MNPSSLRAWLRKDTERSARYEEAHIDRAHGFVDEIITLADMRPADRLEAAQRRLQVEAKWVAGRL